MIYVPSHEGPQLEYVDMALSRAETKPAGSLGVLTVCQYELLVSELAKSYAHDRVRR